VTAGAGAHGRAARRRRRRWLAAPLAVLLGLSASLTTVLPAQDVVGHQPEASPFRDLVNKQGLTLFAGRFAGNTGPAGVGARPGLALGARLAVRLGGPVDLWATLAEARSSRRVIDAAGDTARVTGVENLRLLLADLGLALNLTGSKTWHGLAPYVGVGLGITTPTQSVLDPGGFQITTAFSVMPTIGTRWFVTRSFALDFEARDYYNRYQYPLSFFNLPFAGHADDSPVLPISAGDRAWAHNFTLWAGVTYAFTF
jgi:hypothetical protein